LSPLDNRRLFASARISFLRVSRRERRDPATAAAAAVIDPRAMITTAAALRGKDSGCSFVAIARAPYFLAREDRDSPAALFPCRFPFPLLSFSFSLSLSRLCEIATFRSDGPINIIKATGRLDTERFINGSIYISDNRRHRAEGWLIRRRGRDSHDLCLQRGLSETTDEVFE